MKIEEQEEKINEDLEEQLYCAHKVIRIITYKEYLRKIRDLLIDEYEYFADNELDNLTTYTSLLENALRKLQNIYLERGKDLKKKIEEELK